MNGKRLRNIGALHEGLVSLIMVLSAPAFAKVKSNAPPPIVRTVVVPPLPAETFQNWRVERFGQSMDAYTENDSGSEFGVLCGKESCQYYVGLKKACEDGAYVPGLLNSNAGATPISFTCRVVGDKAKPTYVMITNQTLKDEVFSAAQIAIAFPLDGGDFNVARFSTYGAHAAMARAVQLEGTKPAAGQTGLRDSTY